MHARSLAGGGSQQEDPAARTRARTQTIDSCAFGATLTMLADEKYNLYRKLLFFLRHQFAGALYHLSCGARSQWELGKKLPGENWRGTNPSRERKREAEMQQAR